MKVKFIISTLLLILSVTLECVSGDCSKSACDGFDMSKISGECLKVVNCDSLSRLGKSLCLALKDYINRGEPINPTITCLTLWFFDFATGARFEGATCACYKLIETSEKIKTGQCDRQTLVDAIKKYGELCQSAIVNTNTQAMCVSGCQTCPTPKSPNPPSPCKLNLPLKTIKKLIARIPDKRMRKVLKKLRVSTIAGDRLYFCFFLMCLSESSQNLFTQLSPDKTPELLECMTYKCCGNKIDPSCCPIRQIQTETKCKKLGLLTSSLFTQMTS